MPSINSQHFSTGIVVREGLDADYLITNGRVVASSSDITVLQSDYVVAVKQGAAINVFLPANPHGGNNIVIKDLAGQAATYNLTVKTTDGSTIDGASSVILSSNYAAVSLLYFNGYGWSVL